MGTTGVRRPECRSINPAGIQICHARENRRGISEGTWTVDRDVDGKEGRGNGGEGMQARRADAHHERRRAREGWGTGTGRGWWASTSLRKHGGAAVLYDASVPRPLFNLSATFWYTSHFHRPRNDDTRYVDPRRLSRRLARSHRWQKRRSKLQTHFQMPDDVISLASGM